MQPQARDDDSKPYHAVIVARNNLDLLKVAARTTLLQDVPVELLIVDNGSSDGTAAWLRDYCRRDQRVSNLTFYPQHSVARAWNAALQFLFKRKDADRVLVLNQDVVLRPDTVRWLAAENADFVTGVGSADPSCVEPPTMPARTFGLRLIYPEPRPDATRPHPDFSCFMISRACYERVGPFDENFLGAYCEDSDYHVRMHRAGIHAYCIDLPFWHVGGGAQTAKRADRAEQQRINEQAERNREYFKSKWGFAVGSPEYYVYFGNDAPDAAGADGGDLPIVAAPI